MDVETVEGLQIDRCPSCRGLLLDHGEMSAILREHGAAQFDDMSLNPVSEVMDDAPAFCFTCDQRMQRSRGPGGIHVDACPVCKSVFLDQGELGQIQKLL